MEGKGGMQGKESLGKKSNADRAQRKSRLENTLLLRV